MTREREKHLHRRAHIEEQMRKEREKCATGKERDKLLCDELSNCQTSCIKSRKPAQKTARDLIQTTEGENKTIISRTAGRRPVK